jgi:FkbM family methyltransferase
MATFCIFCLTEIAPLCLDIGAAVGTKAISYINRNASARVVCFEPFAGNIGYLQQRCGGCENIRIVEAACSDFSGDGVLYVRSIVPENAHGVWKHFPGCSSVGKLIPASEAPALREGQTQNVTVCRIDNEVAEPVRLMKLDVQGGEAAVLCGARRLIEEHGVDAMLCEFSGDEEVIAFLADHGYTMFDLEYLYVPRDERYRERLPFVRFRDGKLSTGMTARHGAIIDKPHQPKEYARFLNETRHEFGYLQTDLLCVRDKFLAEFTQRTFAHLSSPH